jgi:hypothetical protein
MVLTGFERSLLIMVHTLKSLKRHLEGLGDGTVTTILSVVYYPSLSFCRITEEEILIIFGKSLKRRLHHVILIS